MGYYNLFQERSGGERMKCIKKDNGFVLSFFINLLFNLEWAIPAVICLILYFIFGISLWWTFGAVFVWIIIVLTRTSLLFALNKAGNQPEKQRENKNPYSSSAYKPLDKE